MRSINSPFCGKETVLHGFTGYPDDGAEPSAGLVLDAKGNLYGTTQWGGASEAGTLFKVDKRGKETVLYSLDGRPDGAFPFAVLLRDAEGNLYGTASEGAVSYYGTVFELIRGIE